MNEVHATLTPGQLQPDSSSVSVTGGLAFDVNEVHVILTPGQLQVSGKCHWWVST